MFTYRGKTALITGASSGIGAVFARELAARGMNMILVARSEDRLRALASELAGPHGIRAEIIAADLGQEGAAAAVYAATGRLGLAVDLLVNNAGFATHGPFETLAPERDHAEVMLNVTAVVDLTHLFLPAMVERGEGGIINVASTAAFQPLPYMAVYGATKAFVLSFSEALWTEYRERGVRVVALCPGATATPFFSVVGTEDAAVGRKATPEAVVAAGLRGLERHRSYVVPGLFNYVAAQSPRLVPRSVAARIAAWTMRPGRSGKPAPAAQAKGNG